MDAMGLLAHTFAKPLDDGSKIYKLAFATFSNALNTNYLLKSLGAFKPWGIIVGCQMVEFLLYL